MTNKTENVLDLGKTHTSPPIDFVWVALQALRYWYVFLLSIILFVGFAYYKDRITPRVYTTFSSIIIKEQEEQSGGQLLYTNALISPYRNYLNELYIIKSYPLIQKVVEDLNFQVSFYEKGKFLTIERYKDFPVSCRVIDSHNQTDNKFLFKIINSSKFQLWSEEQNKVEKNHLSMFNFGDTISFKGLELLFTRLREVKSEANETYEFNFQSAALLTPAYAESLNANWAEQGAGVINLSISGQNVDKSIDFLNGLVKAYQGYDLNKKNQTATMTIDFISSQLKDIRDSLAIVENVMERFKERTAVVDMENETSRLVQKLEALDAQKTEHIVKENYYEYLTNYISSIENLDPVIAPSSVGITDAVLGALIAKMVDIQLGLKTYKRDEKYENPLAKGKVNSLVEIRKSIIEAVKNIRATESIRNSYLLKQIVSTENLLVSLPSSERSYISIKRNYSLLENLYIFLLQKKSEAGISKASNATDIVVVNTPRQVGGAILPNTTQNFLLSFLIGLFLPFLAFVGIDYFNTTIRSKEDIEKILRIPLIGAVGHNSVGDSLTVFNKPQSGITESFRALRTNLTYFLAGGVKSPVVLVSSSVSGEGKTYTTINLGSIMSVAGKRTLIVGADLRRPRLFSDFNLNNEIGLSNYLAGMATFEEVLQPTSHKDLFLVSGGPIPPNPAELLIGNRFKNFLEEAKKSFDFIIVDTAPIAIVVDAIGLLEYADHTIFVVREGLTPKKLLNVIKNIYESGRQTNISLLINDINKSGYRKSAYGYGYDDYKDGQGYYS